MTGASTMELMEGPARWADANGITVLLGAYMVAGQRGTDGPRADAMQHHQAPLISPQDVLVPHAAMINDFPSMTQHLIYVVVTGALTKPEAYRRASVIYQRAGLADADFAARRLAASPPVQAATAVLAPVNLPLLRRLHSRYDPNDGAVAALGNERWTRPLDVATDYVYDAWARGTSEAGVDLFIGFGEPAATRWIIDQWGAEKYCNALEVAARVLDEGAAAVESAAGWIVEVALTAAGMPDSVVVLLSAIARLMVRQHLDPVHHLARGLRILGAGLCLANGRERCASVSALADDLTRRGRRPTGRPRTERADWQRVVSKAGLAASPARTVTAEPRARIERERPVGTPPGSTGKVVAEPPNTDIKPRGRTTKDGAMQTNTESTPTPPRVGECPNCGRTVSPDRSKLTTQGRSWIETGRCRNRKCQNILLIRSGGDLVLGEKNSEWIAVDTIPRA